MKCPVCLKDNCIDFSDKRVEKPYRMFHCLSCDVVFSHPMKSASADWYETNEEGLLFKISAQAETHIGWNHRQFLKEALPVKTLLDIGCSRGDFIKEAENRGYLVSGIDFDKTNIKLARENFALRNVYPTTIEEFILKYPDKKFDVVTFFEVLEHLPDPKLFLDNVKKLLNRQGYIAVSVPNRNRYINTIAYLDKPPYHLIRWTEKALSNFITQMGFKLIHIYTSPITSEDLTDIIRFGIGRRILKAGKDKSRPEFIQTAQKLYKLKQKIFKIFTVTLAQILRTVGCQGNGLYCLAQLGDSQENE